MLSYAFPQHIRFVDTFPMTANGNVQKFLMREHEIRELGLEALAKTITA